MNVCAKQRRVQTLPFFLLAAFVALSWRALTLFPFCPYTHARKHASTNEGLVRHNPNSRCSVLSHKFGWQPRFVFILVEAAFLYDYTECFFSPVRYPTQNLCACMYVCMHALVRACMRAWRKAYACANKYKVSESSTTRGKVYNKRGGKG